MTYGVKDDTVNGRALHDFAVLRRVCMSRTLKRVKTFMALVLVWGCGGSVSDPIVDSGATSGDGGADSSDAAPEAQAGSWCVSAAAASPCADPVTGGEDFTWTDDAGAAFGCVGGCPAGATCQPITHAWTGTCQPHP